MQCHENDLRPESWPWHYRPNNRRRMPERYAVCPITRSVQPAQPSHFDHGLIHDTMTNATVHLRALNL
jgi:hypothetical protein